MTSIPRPDFLRSGIVQFCRCHRPRGRHHQGAAVRQQHHYRRRTLSTTTTTAKGEESDEGGYRTIGSFHNSHDVEELIRLPKERYVPPALPFDVSSENNILDRTTRTTAAGDIKSNDYSYEPFANSRRYHEDYPRLHRHSWTFLNHGAFGLALEAGLRRANSWRDFAETQPLRYFDRYLLDHLVHGARGMVDFVTRDKNENEMMTEDDDDSDAVRARVREGTAMIPNVTSGMNAVIGGHARCSGVGGSRNEKKLVFYYDIAYGSTKKMCRTYHGEENAIEIPFEEHFLPSLMQKNAKTTANVDRGGAEVFISALDAAVRGVVATRRGGKSTSSSSCVAGSLLILEHITSNTAIRFPVAAIAKHAKEEYGMLVAVDGAHALLSLPLDMGTLLSTGSNDYDYDNDARPGGGGHVDVYITNAHKWFSSPRGAAMMFCANPAVRETLLSRPAVVSHGVDDGFLSRFLWDGCRDHAAQLSLTAVLDYWNDDAIDADVARGEMSRNLREGVRILASHWHPGACGDNGDGADASCLEEHSAEAGVTLVPMDVHAPQMSLVRLPDRISGGRNEGGASSSSFEQPPRTSADAKRVQDFLYGQNVEVPVKCVRGVLYARVSCHVYNTAEEFDRLASVALKH